MAIHASGLAERTVICESHIGNKIQSNNKEISARMKRTS